MGKRRIEPTVDITLRIDGWNLLFETFRPINTGNVTWIPVLLHAVENNYDRVTICDCPRLNGVRGVCSPPPAPYLCPSCTVVREERSEKGETRRGPPDEVSYGVQFRCGMIPAAISAHRNGSGKIDVRVKSLGRNHAEINVVNKKKKNNVRDAVRNSKSQAVVVTVHRVRIL